MKIALDSAITGEMMPEIRDGGFTQGRTGPCVDSPELFMPDRENKESTEAAKQGCRSCLPEVQIGCLIDAIKDENALGVRGGLDTRERNKLIKRYGGREKVARRLAGVARQLEQAS